MVDKSEILYCLLPLLLLIMLWCQRNCWRLVWKINGWRGVLQQPILWILLLIFLDPKCILDIISRLRNYFQRPLAVIIGTRVLLYVDDPRCMERILNSSECLNKTFMQEGFFARKGLLHAKGQKWKIRRKQLNPAFSHSIITNFFKTFNLIGDQLQRKFTQEMQGDEVNFKDVEDLLSRAVLEASCQTTMGTETHFTQKDVQGIAQTYKRLMDLSALKIIKPWLQIDFIFRILDRKNYDSSVESNKLVEDFVMQIIQRKHKLWKQKIQDKAKTEIDPKNDIIDENVKDIKDGFVAQRRIFIEQMFHLAESGEMTLQDIINESHSMVLVSFETVSNSITIALLLLAMNVGCQEKLRREIKKTFVSDSTLTVNLMQLQEMHYLDMIVNESLRLLTTIPMNMRLVSKDFALYDNLDIPKDTIVVLDIFNMQRDELHWGPKAQQFYPEHFAKEKSERHPYSFIPFSKGLRWCIGWRYSIFLIKIFLIKLISNFEFQTSTKLEHLRFVEGVSLKFQNPDTINFQIRQLHNTNF